MKSQYSIPALAVLIVLGVGTYGYLSGGSQRFEEAVFCTADALQCPDGSYVGRTGPNCEFVCPGGTTDSGGLNMIIDDGSSEIVKVGKIVCLPHVNTEGPQTMECAFGLHASDGTYYALDGGDMPDQINAAPMNEDLRISGTFTAVEKLSSDFWQRYPIVGIITVTAIEKI